MNILSPKKQFMANQQLSEAFMNMMVHPVFQAGAAAALAEYANRLDSRDPTTAPALGGARDMMRILMNLGDEARTPIERENVGKLDPV